jgi:uncharacterized protein YkwD
MNRAIIAIIILFSFVSFSCTGIKSTGVDAATVNVPPGGIENDILVLINKYRRSKGMSPLQMNNIIVDVARKHSAGMANGSVAFGHDGFNDRLKTLSETLHKIQGAAENVASGQTSAAEVVDGWIKSPHHKANIEGNFAETGIGVVANKKGVLYYTQIFVR